MLPRMDIRGVSSFVAGQGQGKWPGLGVLIMLSHVCQLDFLFEGLGVQLTKATFIVGLNTDVFIDIAATFLWVFLFFKTATEPRS